MELVLGLASFPSPPNNPFFSIFFFLSSVTSCSVLTFTSVPTSAATRFQQVFLSHWTIYRLISSSVGILSGRGVHAVYFLPIFPIVDPSLQLKQPPALLRSFLSSPLPIIFHKLLLSAVEDGFVLLFEQI